MTFVKLKTRGKPNRKRKRMVAKRETFVAKMGCCYYCGLTVEQCEPPHPRAATLDHLIPKVRGGKSTWSNLVLACYLCNHAKADMTENEFRAFRRAKMLGANKREALRLARSTPAQDSPQDESSEGSRRQGDERQAEEAGR